MEIIPNAEALIADPWPAYFGNRGHTSARRIGAGVEGVIYVLGEDLIAKVWSGRPPADFELTRRVYADIARHPLPFATPEILDLEEHEGVLVTYERELPGVSMRGDSAHEDYERELPAQHNDALLAVLRGLASVPGTDAMRRLTVKGDDRPLWRDHDRFQDALAALVARAAARHSAAIAAHVPDFDTGVERTQRALRSLPDARVTAIHGDLVPPNIHIDPAGRPVAVLDFGFYTTAGDPAFEAAVTAAIWDMYGPHAEEHTAELTRLFAHELGYAPATLAAYQAAYALTTYDLFGQDDSEGHFRWCAGQLRRNPVFCAQSGRPSQPLVDGGDEVGRLVADDELVVPDSDDAVPAGGVRLAGAAESAVGPSLGARNHPAPPRTLTESAPPPAMITTDVEQSALVD